MTEVGPNAALAVPGRPRRYHRSTMAKKLPKSLAILDEDLCTGCEACVAVCPVDCIDTVPGPRYEMVMQHCHIDLPRCIGCTLCPQVCPWDCITMVPSDQVVQVEKYAQQLGR